MLSSPWNASNFTMVAEFPIADELLADAIDSGDRRSVSDALERPDPFENIWKELTSYQPAPSPSGETA